MLECRSVDSSDDVCSIESQNSTSLDESFTPKFSHLCVVTYWTKEGLLFAVDLSYIGQDCFSIPSILGKIYGSQTRRLDLSFNSIRILDGLHMFPLLQELILDNNDLGDNVHFKHLPQLHTLSLNKNHFNDLEALLSNLTKAYPRLSYLSLLGNPACPDQLSNLERDDEDYQRYRYYILHQIPNLRFLDSTPVKGCEKTEAKRIGHYMKVAKPTENVTEEVSDEAEEAERSLRYSPLTASAKREGSHRGSFGRLKQRYTGTQSEGNRFIRDNEL